MRNLRVRAIARAVVLAGVATLICATTTAAAPRLEIDTTEIDVGTFVRGETAQASFELRNTGDEELRILEARPG